MKIPKRCRALDLLNATLNQSVCGNHFGPDCSNYFSYNRKILKPFASTKCHELIDKTYFNLDSTKCFHSSIIKSHGLSIRILLSIIWRNKIRISSVQDEEHDHLLTAC